MDNFEKRDGDCRRARRYLSACQTVDRKNRVNLVAGKCCAQAYVHQTFPYQGRHDLGVSDNVARSKIEDTIPGSHVSLRQFPASEPRSLWRLLELDLLSRPVAYEGPNGGRRIRRVTRPAQLAGSLSWQAKQCTRHLQRPESPALQSDKSVKDIIFDKGVSGTRSRRKGYASPSIWRNIEMQPAENRRL
jgi:hypothetical protein